MWTFAAPLAMVVALTVGAPASGVVPVVQAQT